MTTNKENTTNGKKRTRRTIEERIAATQAEMARLQAIKDGTYVRGEATSGNPVLTQVKKALRVRKTALHNAQIITDGRAATEKSPRQSTLAEKIENAEKRLNNLRETKKRSDQIIADTPFDIERLEALIELAESGEDITFPDNLTPLPSESEKTDTEHEVTALTANDPEVTEN